MPVRMALAAIVVVQLVLLRDVWQAGEPSGGDLTIHYAEATHLSRAIAAGDADAWSPMGNLGYAPGYYYQVAPQLAPALVHRGAGGCVSLLDLFKGFVVAALILGTLTTFVALRRFGVSSWRALGGAAATTLVASGSRWGGGADAMFDAGLYTQAWAMVFFPLAAVASWRYLERGERLVRAVALVLATGVCHPLVAVALAPVLACAPWWRVPVRELAVRVSRLTAAVAITSAFFWLPILVHHDGFGGFPTRGETEAGTGLLSLVEMLLTGDLLDHRRIPLLTLALAGAVISAVRGDRVLRAVLVPAIVFLALVALGPVIGAIGDDLVPWARMLAPVQLFLAAAAGIAVVDLVQAACAASRRWLGPAAFAVVTAAVMSLVAATDARFQGLIWGSREHPAAHRDDLEMIVSALRDAPPGRVLVSTSVPATMSVWRYVPFIETGRASVLAFGGAPVQSSPNFVHLARSETAHAARAYGARYVVIAPFAASRFPSGRVLVETPVALLVDLGPAPLFRPVEIIGATGIARSTRRAEVGMWVERGDVERDRHLGIGGDDGGARRPPTARVLAERESWSRYEADVEVTGDAPSAIALTVTHHPAWRVSIDGRAARVRRLSPDILGVDVPPGVHTVVFTFERPAWTWGLLALALATLAGLALRARIAPIKEEP